MDLIILVGIASALLVVILTIFFLQKKKGGTEAKEAAAPPQRGVPLRAQEGVPRRAQIARNQRNRLRQNAPAAAPAAAAALQAADAEGDNDDENPDGDGQRMPQGAVLDEKMGAKKRAKMEAKEQKRLHREQELIDREQRKVKEAKEEAERKQQEDFQEEADRKRAEAERLVKEERERKEHEEYLKMKAGFSVEEEGFEEGDADDQDNLLADFIQYIKDNKVVLLEDLAVAFKLKTQQAIERIQDLQANGTLTGVIDDRGKFIYVSEEELAAVAKFIKQRGRVSIVELAESSNNLINLTPVSAGAGEGSS
ncbi:GL12371 [Drosophila persimilis]|uniref:DDRGK domain-containing protein 1 n=3 Tax=pseudoobscura subgroup TaxID=32358 RepID=DDRGK_DROPS|nr:DDRGK domain-containing protein 1 [Drosophila pseudoobscura]XP_002019364.1 DDRGK domain-containing protein 1 [Drosophila persimilis]B4GMC4.1 RecName: Full=DDRGK domain-containing protein 1; Flags: Precursor [Drosophila persimilis]Q295B1.1 RecName: Full=DDRGK domain-containing protein 1; Flags: Precursor [Drosophila pseudoobscura pseudoobscura]EDW37998.1 GL12371 [Drosophila persimilis]